MPSIPLVIGIMSEKQKLNFFTIVIRTIAVLFGVIVIGLITEMSKLIVPVSGMGGIIRGFIMIGLFSVLWKGVKQIKIGL